MYVKCKFKVCQLGKNILNWQFSDISFPIRIHVVCTEKKITLNSVHYFLFLCFKIFSSSLQFFFLLFAKLTSSTLSESNPFHAENSKSSKQCNFSLDQTLIRFQIWLARTSSWMDIVWSLSLISSLSRAALFRLTMPGIHISHVI